MSGGTGEHPLLRAVAQQPHVDRGEAVAADGGQQQGGLLGGLGVADDGPGVVVGAPGGPFAFGQAFRAGVGQGWKTQPRRCMRAASRPVMVITAYGRPRQAMISGIALMISAPAAGRTEAMEPICRTWERLTGRPRPG